MLHIHAAWRAGGLAMAGTSVSGELFIIEAGMHEIDLVVPLFDQYRIFYGQPSDLDSARRFLRARIQHRDSVIYLALTGKGANEMGAGFALLYPSFNSITATPIWILNDLYVLEGLRRQGIAQRLIDRGRELAEDTGAAVISLSTGRENHPSRKLYERLGFALDETFCTYLLSLD
jgi:GNAT superfamily N-acetyltransferase